MYQSEAEIPVDAIFFNYSFFHLSCHLKCENDETEMENQTPNVRKFEALAESSARSRRRDLYKKRDSLIVNAIQKIKQHLLLI